jgi:hypothetical protein
MTYQSTLRSAVSVAALVTGTAAFADVSAQQVWNDWQTEFAIFGSGLSFDSEDYDGSTLVVRNLTLQSESDGVSTLLEMGDLTFAEQGDGSVTITAPDSYPMTITSDEGAIVTIGISHPGMEITVSGTPEALDYTVSAPVLSIALTDVQGAEEEFNGDVQFTIQNTTGNYSTRITETRQMTYDLRSDGVDILVDATSDAGLGEYVTAGGRITGITFEGQVEAPADAEIDYADNPFAAGVAMAFGYTTQGAEFVFDVNADGEAATGSFTAGPGSLTAQFSEQSASYITNSTDIAFSLTTATTPFPIEGSLAQYGITFEAPLARAETPQPFTVGIDLVDLVLSDMIWSMFDPGNVLPRDPATVQIGLAGQARPQFDLMDPAQEAAMMRAVMPVELDEVTLERLNISLAGAQMTGEGAFTFDNSDLETFAPLPRPTGEVAIQITGLNRLLDNLVAMGLVPADQMMAPRMMMGMFARSTGDDQLETRLQVTDDGQVLANGQRIR